MAAAFGTTSAETLETLRREAAEELSGFLERMSPADGEQALRAAAARLLRERLALPDLHYEM